MHIGLIGGVERSESRYAEVAASAGHSFEFHDGDTAGRGGITLASLVERSDLVICITDINSHNAVLGARKYARAYGRRCLLLRRIGLSRFRVLLQELEAARPAA
jgi:Uncharacterized protein conserved in bacteria (DUF2325)